MRIYKNNALDNPRHPALLFKKRFYAGCQPRCPSEHLYSRRKFKSPARTHHISLAGARYPSEYLKALVLILPNRSSAFTCRYTILFSISLLYPKTSIKSTIFLIYPVSKVFHEFKEESNNTAVLHILSLWLILALFASDQLNVGKYIGF